MINYLPSFRLTSLDAEAMFKVNISGRRDNVFMLTYLPVLRLTSVDAETVLMINYLPNKHHWMQRQCITLTYLPGLRLTSVDAETVLMINYLPSFRLTSLDAEAMFKISISGCRDNVFMLIYLPGFRLTSVDAETMFNIDIIGCRDNVFMLTYLPGLRLTSLDAETSIHVYDNLFSVIYKSQNDIVLVLKCFRFCRRGEFCKALSILLDKGSIEEVRYSFICTNTKRFYRRGKFCKALSILLDKGSREEVLKKRFYRRGKFCKALSILLDKGSIEEMSSVKLCLYSWIKVPEKRFYRRDEFCKAVSILLDKGSREEVSSVKLCLYYWIKVPEKRFYRRGKFCKALSILLDKGSVEEVRYSFICANTERFYRRDEFCKALSILLDKGSIEEVRYRFICTNTERFYRRDEFCEALSILLDKGSVEEVRYSFICTNTERFYRRGEFCKALSILLDKGSVEEYAELFDKIDVAREGTVDWDKFASHMLLEFYERDDRVKSTQVPQWRDLKNLLSPHKDVIQRIAYLKNTNRYIAISKEGSISLWGQDLRLQRAFRTGTDSCKARDLWVTHFVPLQQINKLALAFTSKEIAIYDMSTKLDFNCQYKVQGLPHTPLCLDYWDYQIHYTMSGLLILEKMSNPNNSNEALLVWGDVGGYVNALFFSSANIALFERPPAPAGEKQVIVFKFI
ncbi:LOW QUALITY PROTEIN: hypothetical protein KUTeg_009166 [Tegillarca granosa]|uniref:EF-hand domain-containing protein n=1 Tax=Tegillarca granosa TaxID=220873 RepID=A0ABQ9F7D9_TEGGR|nr:LOW QUALITY PROTEIN: hypothetical protein KUTeg_009166 [Tegillarca granosa]